MYPKHKKRPQNKNLPTPEKFYSKEKFSTRPQNLLGLYRAGGQNFGFIDPISPQEKTIQSLESSEDITVSNIELDITTLNTTTREESLFVHGSKALDALDGDIVEYQPFQGKYGKMEARIRSIHLRAPTLHFGIYRKEGTFGMVKLFEGLQVRIFQTYPNPQKNSTDSQNSSGKGSNPIPKNGDTIGVQITGSGRGIGAKIISILGKETDPGYYEQLAILQSGVPVQFPEKIREIARKLTPHNPSDHLHRLDLQERTIITIDGPDAKDLDDAIEVEKHENGYTLWVHIADVSAYVPSGSELDGEAFKRGTSTYLPGAVIPMLPGEISNHLCSLHPGGPKLCFSIQIELDANGMVAKSTLHETVINSKYRSTYQEVEDLKTFGEDLSNFSDEVKKMLKNAWELREILVKRRNNEGKIEFIGPDYELKLTNGKLVEIREKPHLEAENLIEEFMVLANEEVAKYASRMGLPFLYRVHESPTETGLTRLREILEPLGIHFQPRNELKPSSKELQKVVEQVHANDPKGLRTRELLSCMTKALYSEKSKGHFGLALEHYSHFTSPIRRYPDLKIHQILKLTLDGPVPSSMIHKLKGELPKVARQTSTLERRAEKLEYTIRDTYICEWLSDRVGEIFDGRVVTILENGYFVQILPGVEGFVAFGTKRRSSVVPGSEGKYKLMRVDILNRKIDLMEVE